MQSTSSSKHELLAPMDSKWGGAKGWGGGRGGEGGRRKKEERGMQTTSASKQAMKCTQPHPASPQLPPPPPPFPDLLALVWLSFQSQWPTPARMQSPSCPSLSHDLHVIRTHLHTHQGQSHQHRPEHACSITISMPLVY